MGGMRDGAQLRPAVSRRPALAVASLLLLCGVAARLLGSGPSKGSPDSAFLQPASSGLPSSKPAAAPAIRAVLPSNVAAAAAPSTGADTGRACMWATMLGLAVAARAAQHFRTGTTADAGCSLVTKSDLCGAQIGLAGEQPRIIMFGRTPRPHVEIRHRTYKDWRRGRRRNAAALQRFLFREDGTVWRRQGKSRHLKSKKTPAHLRRLKHMVRVTHKEYRRVRLLTGKKVPIPKAEDFIMRKFNQNRAKHHLGTSDRGIGTAMFC